MEDLFRHTLELIEDARRQRIPVDRWTFGGGTVLMRRHGAGTVQITGENFDSTLTLTATQAGGLSVSLPVTYSSPHPRA